MKRKMAEVDSYFTNNGYGSDRLEVRDLPYMSRPVIEAIHDVRPNVVLAGDRGGRLFARSVLKGWKMRFPGEPFPSLDNKIHLARVTGRSADSQMVQKAVRYTLRKAGYQPDSDGGSPSIMYLDDWAVHGETINVLREAIIDMGIGKNKLTYATLCGKQLKGVNHIVGDPSTTLRRSAWDWEGGSESLVGVEYITNDQVTPSADHNIDAIAARTDLDTYLQDYYRSFAVALEAGEVMACECDPKDLAGGVPGMLATLEP